MNEVASAPPPFRLMVGLRRAVVAILMCGLGFMGMGSFAAGAAVADTGNSFPGCPQLNEGDSGPCVAKLQRELNAVHSEYNLPSDSQTFGPATRIALLDFQGRNHLGADGRFGAVAASELQRQYEAASGSNSAPPHRPGTPAIRPASSEAQVAGLCVDNSRGAATRVAKSADTTELQTVISNGSRENAQITLRYSRSNNCAWGLLEGQGKIWIERAPRGSHGVDVMSQQTLTHNSVTHTAAFDLSRGRVRACGQGVNGEDSNGSSVGASVGPDGAGVSESASAGSTRSFGGVRCTRWTPSS